MWGPTPKDPGVVQARSPGESGQWQRNDLMEGELLTVRASWANLDCQFTCLLVLQA